MRFSSENTDLFQVKISSTPKTEQFKKIVVTIHDRLFLFIGQTEKINEVNDAQSSKCQFKQYELFPLKTLRDTILEINDEYATEKDHLTERELEELSELLPELQLMLNLTEELFDALESNNC